LNAAVEISDMFLTQGRIVSTRTRGGVLEDQFDASEGILVDPSKPVSILIDQDSASASEILAACLQDHGRAAIVGKRSFGKGTVQNILPLQYGRSALRLTVARYYRPNGENIHRKRDANDEDQWGVLPDEGFDVDLDPDNLEKLAKRWREASYPLLASNPPNDLSDSMTSSPSQEPLPEKVNPSINEGTRETSESRIDTQLWAAVDALKLDLSEPRKTLETSIH
jgi:carboxyl-terminal processing protease